MIGELTKELDELLGNFFVAPTVGEFYEDSRIGARVLDRMMFVACVTGLLREMLLMNPSEARRFIEEGSFFVQYPANIRNYVSPRCAPRSDNPDVYVVRKGPDGLCYAYLRRDCAPRDSRQVWIGGMTAPQYLKMLARKEDQETLDHAARQIDDLERDSASKHTVVVTRICGDMLYPVEEHLDESMGLPPTLKRALELIREVGKFSGEVTDVASFKQHLDWVDGYVRYALDHNTRYVWVAD